MIFVYCVTYYCNKKRKPILSVHQFNNFWIACNVVAECWADAPINVYTIVDNSDIDIF